MDSPWLTVLQIINVLAGLALMVSSAAAARRLWEVFWVRLVCLLVSIASALAVATYTLAAFTSVEMGIWGAILFRPSFPVMVLGCAILIERFSKWLGGRIR